jgi:hypothetical protein
MTTAITNQNPDAERTYTKRSDDHWITPKDSPTAGVMIEATTLPDAIEFKNVTRVLICSLLAIESPGKLDHRSAAKTSRVRGCSRFQMLPICVRR